MKNIFLLIAFICLANILFSQTSKKVSDTNQLKAKTFIVKAACGECQFKQKGSSCDLAIKYKNKCYFVTGTKIDDHGDAHAKNGFCNAIRTAKVSGTFTKDKFAASSFVLID